MNKDSDMWFDSLDDLREDLRRAKKEINQIRGINKGHQRVSLQNYINNLTYQIKKKEKYER